MKKSLKKINYRQIIYPLFLILIAFLINGASPIRIVLCLLGIGIFVWLLKVKRKYKVLIAILSFLVLIFVDGVLTYMLDRIPIFAYNIVTKGNVKVYNSIGLRVWQCDKNKNEYIVDLFYDKGYSCDAENIDTVYSNSFLTSVIENYSEYKNQYVKVNGKISKKNSLNFIEMQTYNPDSTGVNGYVEFYDNIILRILFDKDEKELNNYDVYDDITVVGVIKNIENNNGGYVIYMYETKIVSIKDMEDYIITVNALNKCEDPSLIYNDDVNNVYQYCLNDAFVVYSDDTKYELSAILSSGKLNVDDLYVGSKEQENNDDRIMYKMNNYNVLVCNNNNVIIGTNKMKIDSVNCNIK